jgi:hypothetical protein
MIRLLEGVLKAKRTQGGGMERDQLSSDRTSHPLPECLTRLLVDPKERIRVAPLSDPKPSLLDRLQWWLTVATFEAISLIFSTALKIAKLWP